jgi:hypothetical protein
MAVVFHDLLDAVRLVLWQGEVFGWSAVDYDPEPWLDQLRAITQFFKSFCVGSGCFRGLLVFQPDHVSCFGCPNSRYIYVFCRVRI